MLSAADNETLARTRAGISRIVEIEDPSPGTFPVKEAMPEKLLQHAWPARYL